MLDYFTEVKNMNEQIDIAKAREQKVVKHNELIQNTRYSLPTQQLKTLSYLISKIKPTDKEFQIYEFQIIDYCKCCGIDYANGKNYKNVKTSLKDLSDNSFWMENEAGGENLFRWLSEVDINKKGGLVKVEFDKKLHPYLIGLVANFTQYELLSTLPMKSQYSIRIYELMKSYAFKKTITLEINDLKKKLMAEQYINFKDFRIKVLEIAMREINEYTDLKVSCEGNTGGRGRAITSVTFTIKLRSGFDKLRAQSRAIEDIKGLERGLDGQMSIYEY